jgi:hypothetical protein
MFILWWQTLVSFGSSPTACASDRRRPEAKRDDLNINICSIER